MIVEFVGESGCGKTTLAETIVKEDGSIRLRRILSKSASVTVLSRIMTNRDCRSLYIDLLRLSFQENGCSRLWKNAYYLCGFLNELMLAGGNDEVVLFDQGIIQFLSFVYFDKPPVGDLYNKIIRKLCCWNVRFVYCQCPNDILIKRIKARALTTDIHRRIEKVDESVIIERKKLFAALVDKIPSDALIPIDTSRDLHDNAVDVMNFICREQ